MIQRREVLAVAVVAMVATATLWTAPTVPAFHHDWAWPISRGAAVRWFCGYLGQWDPDSLGQPQLLPTQTFFVAISAAAVAVFGAPIGLAVVVTFISVAALTGMCALLRALGIAWSPARLAAGVLYTLSPIVYTRLAAGHLPYLVGYAALPWFSWSLCTRRPTVATNIAGGVAFALALSQIQFGLYAAIVALSVAVWQRSVRRPAIIFVIGLALQLQGLVPLVLSSVRLMYLPQQTNDAWLANLSVPWAAGVTMRGYFTAEYEHAALPATGITLWLLEIAALAIATRRGARYAAVAGAAMILGTIVAAGVLGPLRPVLLFAAARIPAVSIFRDGHYALVFVAIGCAIAVGAALDALRTWPALLVFGAALGWIIAPAAGARELSAYRAPPVTVAGAVQAYRIARRTGPGRFLWFPPEMPVRLRPADLGGIDVEVYGTWRVPIANEYREDQPLAFATEALRAAPMDARPAERLGIRYIAFQRYLRGSRNGALGMRAKLSDSARSAPEVERALASLPGVVKLMDDGETALYELPDAAPVHERARLTERGGFRSVKGVDVRVSDEDAAIDAFAATAQPDPQRGWSSAYVAPFYAPWTSAAYFPVRFTSGRAVLTFVFPRTTCAWIARDLSRDSLGRWHAVPTPAGAAVSIVPRGISAVTVAPGACDGAAQAGTATVWWSHYDPGWLAVTARGIQRPQLADGWAMAWAGPVVRWYLYVPAIGQAAAFVFGVASALWLARLSVQAIPGRRP